MFGTRSVVAAAIAFLLVIGPSACSREPGSTDDEPRIGRGQQHHGPDGEILQVGDPVDVAQFQQQAQDALLEAGTFQMTSTLSSNDPDDPSSVTVVEVDITDPQNGRAYSRTDYDGEVTEAVISDGGFYVLEDGQWTQIGDAQLDPAEYTAWLSSIESMTYDGNERINGTNLGRFILLSPGGDETIAWADDTNLVHRVDITAKPEPDSDLEYSTVQEFSNFGQPIDVPDVS